MTSPGKKILKSSPKNCIGRDAAFPPPDWLNPFIEATNQLFYGCDASGSKIQFWGNVEGLLGFSSEELSGDRCKWMKRIHPDDLLRFSESDVEKPGKKPKILEYRFSKKNGSVAYLRETSCQIMDDNSGMLRVIGFIEDITEQRSLFAHVCHLQKMQVFGKLAGGIAHDFNNALTIIQGYAEILQMGLPKEDPGKGYLDEMGFAVERSKTLSSQLMNFSKYKQNAPKAIHPATVVLDFRKMLRRLVEENIELVIKADEESGWVIADPRQLEAMLVNLVINACEAMPAGGKLSIEVFDQDDDIHIVVSDTGMGMEKDVLKRILQQDFSKIPPDEGAGLGLPICLGIAQQSGGKLSAISTPCKGSVFTVSLPRVDPPSQESARAGTPLKLPILSGKGEKVLIVEDDMSVQMAVAVMTKGLGYKVICAANGDEARRILEKDAEIRLVICDLIMPLMGGTELLMLLRQRWPRTKILLTSGYASGLLDRTPQSIFHNTEFLPKPLSRAVLAVKLRELIDA